MDSSPSIEGRGPSVIAFKYSAGAKAQTMPCYDDGTTNTLTTDTHPPAIAFQTDHISQNGTNVSYEVMKTLDTQCPPAVCMSSGQANAEVTEGGLAPTLTLLHEAPIVIDRAAYNQGKNAQYPPHIEQTELMDSLVARGPHAVAHRTGSST